MKTVYVYDPATDGYVIQIHGLIPGDLRQKLREEWEQENAHGSRHVEVFSESIASQQARAGYVD